MSCDIHEGVSLPCAVCAAIVSRIAFEAGVAGVEYRKHRLLCTRGAIGQAATRARHVRPTAVFGAPKRRRTDHSITEIARRARLSRRQVLRCLARGDSVAAIIAGTHKRSPAHHSPRTCARCGAAGHYAKTCSSEVAA